MRSPQATKQMKTLVSVITIVAASLLSGCATTHERPYPNKEELRIRSLGEIYGTSRFLQPAGDFLECRLVTDTKLVAACETLLLHFSHDKNPTVRQAATAHLISLGTLPAFEHGLQAVHDEKTPATRMVFWRCMIRLLQPPVRWPLPSGSKPTEDYMQLLSAISPNQSCPIWPAGLERSRLLQEIIQLYEKDDGTWTDTYIDRIPYVPFSGVRGIQTFTVRESIVRSLLDYVVADKKIM